MNYLKEIKTGMPTTILNLSSHLWCMFFLYCFMACSEDLPQAELNESEIAFDQRLASISSDPTNANRFFIGTEDGMVIFYNVKDNSVGHALTDFDRIYRIVPDMRPGQDSVFWLGTRNMGMFRCRLHSDSLQAISQYCIPAKEKETKYSVYDICVFGEKLLVCTSHGLFSLESEFDNMMHPICVLPDSKEEGYLSPVVYSNMVMTRDSSAVYCASIQGLIRYNTATGDTYCCIPKDVKNIVMRGDSIMALTEKCLYVFEHSSSKVKDSIMMKRPAQLFYYEPTEQVNYFISDNSIQIVEDKNLKNPGEFKEVRLRRTARPSTCHNIIVNDPLRRQSILLTNNSLLRIGHHQDAFNSFGRIDYACVDGDNIYYLLGRKLYRQNTSDKDAPMEACQIKDIDRDVRFMTVKDDELYYVDSDNNCYHAHLYGSYFWNSLWSWEHSFPKPEKEVTAIGKDSENVYIGVRDGFCLIGEPGKDIKLTYKDPFITAFTGGCQKELVFSTLNEGIYRSTNSSFVQMEGTDSIQFIRDVTNGNGGNYFLTNRFLYCLDKNGIANIVDTAKCFSRILAAEEHLYGVGYRGLHDFTTGKDLFIDVAFNPNACVVLNGKLYCGSGNGVYVIENQGKSINGVRTVKFKNAFKPFSRTNLAIILFLLLSIIIGLWWHDRYRMSRRAIRSHKLDFINRIATLDMTREFLSGKTIDKIDQLSEEVVQIDVAKGRKSLETVHRLSKEIQAVTASVPFELRPKLEKIASKIEKEKTKEGEAYIKASEEAIASHSISQIVFQLKGCSSYLQKLKEAKQKVEDYTTLLVYSSVSPYALNLEGTTIKVKTIALDNESSPIEQLSQIETVIGQLTTAEGKDTITTYLRTKIEEASKIAKGRYDHQLTSIRLEYDSCLSQLDMVGTVSDMDRLLRNIVLANQRLFLIQELVAINTTIYDTYGRKREIEKERAEDRKKGVSDPWKAEKRFMEEEKLEAEIAKVPHKILKSVDRFYQCVWQCKDGHILEEIGLREGNQEGKILPLLLSVPKELFPFDRYSELLGGNQKSLYRAKTKLEGLLSIISEEAKEYSKKNPSSIVTLIVKLNECVLEK